MRTCIKTTAKIRRYNPIDYKKLDITRGLVTKEICLKKHENLQSVIVSNNKKNVVNHGILAKIPKVEEFDCS